MEAVDLWLKYTQFYNGLYTPRVKTSPPARVVLMNEG